MTSSRSRRRETATLIKEGAGNWLARPALAAGLTISVALSLAALVVTEANAATDATRYATRLTSLGWRTLILDHDDDSSPGHLSSMECEQLSRQPGVSAAIWLRDDEPRHLLAPYGPVIPVHQIGGTIGAFVSEIDPGAFRNWRSAQTFVDNDSATAATRRPGEYPLRWTIGTTVQRTTALTVELAALGPGTAGNALTVSATPGPVNACALIVEPDQRVATQETISTAFPPLQGFSTRWALAGANEFETSAHRFTTRPSQRFWLAGVTMFLLLWWLTLRIRRSTDAFYAVAGLRPRHISILIVTELLLTIAIAVAIAAAIVAGAALHSHTPTRPLVAGLLASGRYTLTICLLGTTTAILAAQRTITATLDAIKDS